jgi:homoserine kinase
VIRIRVPATTANLGPGFDSLGMAVDIYNYVEIERIAGGELQIEVQGPAATADISRDENNLVYRAAARVLEMAGHSARGLRLRVTIEAPLARGLGSSASAIVGGMFAANELAGRPLSVDELARETTRMEGHPDNVVPCLVGGLTASLCLEDRVLYERVQPAENLACVFFVPDYELDTATARGVMPRSVSMKDAVFNGSRIPFVVSRLRSGELDMLDEIMDDRLHQPYRIPLVRGYEMVSLAARESGAAAVCISGAGPTILAVCDRAKAEAVAAAGGAALRELGIGVECRIAAPDAKGCQREG